MEANGLAQKGIFRTSARAVLVKRLKKVLSSEPVLSQVRVDPAIKNDAPLFASLIKLWLRELPTGLLNSLDPSRLQVGVRVRVRVRSRCDCRCVHLREWVRSG